MKNTEKTRNLADELGPFEDQWVALVEDKVVACGENPKQVKERAEQQGYTDYVFHLVPSFSRTLLGQSGFFENYKVIFERYRNRFQVIPHRT